MKKTLFLPLIIVFIATILAGTVSFVPQQSPVSGFEEFHDPNAPRVVDRANILSKSFEDSVGSSISSYSDRYKMDFVVLTVDGYKGTEFNQDIDALFKYSPYGYEFGDYVSDFYDYNGYGVGNSFSGIILGINMEEDNHEYWISTTGDAIDLFEDEIPGLQRKIQPILASGDYEGAVSAFLTYATTVAERRLATMQYDFGYVPSRLSDNIYDDTYALSPGVKASAAETLASYRSRYYADCIVKLVRSYSASEFGSEAEEYYEKRGGLYTLNDYAADTFKSNGYGVGDFDNGAIIVLYIGQHNQLLEVGCYASGSTSKCFLNTAGVIFDYIKNDSTPDEMVASCVYYYDLVIDLETNNMFPVLQSQSTDPVHRVVDGAGIIKDSFEPKLAKKLDKLSKRYKMDFVVVTTYTCDVREFGKDRVIANNHGLYGAVYDGYDYGEDYFKYYGYGPDRDDPSGVILVINSNPENTGYYLSAVGKAAEKFTGSRLETLEDAIRVSIPGTGTLNSRKTAELKRSLNKFVTYVKSLMIFGHYPLSFSAIIFTLLAAVVVALIVNAIFIADRTSAPAPAPGASFIPSEGINIRDKKEVFIRKDTSRVAHSTSSSGGGSFGGSSRSGGGFSRGGGSSGRSHGGGGGRF